MDLLKLVSVWEYLVHQLKLVVEKDLTPAPLAALPEVHWWSTTQVLER
jgi:hypothetical protein